LDFVWTLSGGIHFSKYQKEKRNALYVFVVAIHIRSAPAGCLNWPNRSGKRKRTKA
jgi:hypothetical protein